MRERTVLFVAWPQFDAGEVTFWRRLDAVLREHGLRLVIASTTVPPRDLGVAHLAAVPTIDTLWPGPASAGDGTLLDLLGLDPRTLLVREEAWGAPSVIPAIDAYRREAMEHIAAHWLQALAVLQPAAVVIWNAQHVTEIILDAASRQCGVPVMYVERAPIPQALLADESGLSVASSVARRASWSVSDQRWQRCAEAISRWLAAGMRTWWEQPPSRRTDRPVLRHELGIPADRRVILFAGQVDEDTQQFLFSPQFEDNVSAFQWLLEQLRGRDGIFVLGKQHPKSRTPAVVYQQALAESGVAGTWRADVSIDDALLVADRVAAVNSTVLYEALARAHPVLSLGDWLLTGRDVAYEVRDAMHDAAVVDAWLKAEDNHGRQRAWHDGLAFLLAHSLYTYAPDAEACGMHGARALAQRIVRLAGTPAPWVMPSRIVDAWLSAQPQAGRRWLVPGEQPAVDATPDWQRAHALRHQLLGLGAAAREGRRLVIWGTGVAGRLAADLLTAVGVDVDVFVTSRPGPWRLNGIPVITPSELKLDDRRDIIAVASKAAHEIEPMLVGMGFVPGDDFTSLDCDTLVALAPAMAATGS